MARLICLYVCPCMSRSCWCWSVKRLTHCYCFSVHCIFESHRIIFSFLVCVINIKDCNYIIFGVILYSFHTGSKIVYSVVKWKFASTSKFIFPYMHSFLYGITKIIVSLKLNVKYIWWYNERVQFYRLLFMTSLYVLELSWYFCFRTKNYYFGFSYCLFYFTVCFISFGILCAFLVLPDL